MSFHWLETGRALLSKPDSLRPLVMPLVLSALNPHLARNNNILLRVMNVVIWGLAATLSWFMILMQTPSGIPPLQFWGLWLYGGVTTANFAVEAIALFGRGGVNNDTSGTNLHKPVMHRKKHPDSGDIENWVVVGVLGGIMGLIILTPLLLSAWIVTLDNQGTFHNTTDSADFDGDGDLDVLLHNVRTESEFTAFGDRLCGGIRKWSISASHLQQPAGEAGMGFSPVILIRMAISTWPSLWGIICAYR